MSRDSLIDEMPGGRTLSEWFGRIPLFHDAELRTLKLTSESCCVLVIQAFRLTNEVDERGIFVCDRHCIVTITCEGIFDVDLGGAEAALPSILFDLLVTRDGDDLDVTWSSSYGLAGHLKAKRVRVDHRPSEP